MAPEDDTSPPLADGLAPDLGGSRTAAAPHALGPLPPLIGGKYRPLRLIARGGMGAVYEVVHENTGEHLALKLMLSRSLLTPELVGRFRREARVHSSVRSEHVVRIVDADVAPELDEAPFIVMELLEGEDFERLCQQGRRAADEVVAWMRQLAGALDRAHAEGIVHRDLKPENLFLARRGDLPPVVKILDFGIAKMAGEGLGLSTATGQILGTPRYMAPEQAAAAKEVTAAADRFALGLISFRLLCGRHYYSGDGWIALLREVARGPATRPSELGSDRGRAFDDWFGRACAFEPTARFATCAAQVEALARALEGAPAVASRRRLVRPLALVAVVGTLAAVGFRLAAHREATHVTQAVAQAATEPRLAPSVALAAPAPAAAPGRAPSEPPPAGASTAPRLRRHTVARATYDRNAPRPATKPEVDRDPIWNEP